MGFKYNNFFKNLKIRTALTLNFTLVVFVLLSVFSLVIYYFSAYKIQERFYVRLENRALTTINILTSINGINTKLLRLIEQKTVTQLLGRKVRIYDEADSLIYRSDLRDTAVVPIGILKQIKDQHNIRFKFNGLFAVGIKYIDEQKTYLIVASGWDVSGLNTLSDLRKILFFGSLIGIIFSLILASIFTNQALKPMVQVMNEVKLINDKNLDYRVKIKHKDEIGELAATFNDMLDRIRTSLVFRKNYLTNAAHELRTPLTSMLGTIEVMLIKQRTELEYSETLASLKEEIVHIIDLSNALLLMARLNSNLGIENKTTLKIDELLFHARVDLLAAKPNYKINISFSEENVHDSNLYQITANESLIKILFANLMDNACKYSINKTVQVQLMVYEKWFTLTFQDSGKGIEQENLKLIFEPFFRERNQTETPGHGLGLALCQRIIAAHGGTISVSSKVNVGTKVIVRLPSESEILESKPLLS